MELGMIGLGRMGTNMVRRLLRAGHQRVVYDIHPEAVRVLVKEGAVGTMSLEDFTHKLKRPSAVWMMVPAAVVDPTLKTLIPLLEREDVVIDGGNSYYHDDIRRAAWGSERGYCLMIGGDEAVVRRLDPVFATLAPSVEAAPRTPGREKVRGTADAETTPLRHPEHYPYDLNLADIAEVWRRGSVIASRLLDLAAIALIDNPDLAKFAGRVSDSGEGRWTVMAAIDESVPAPVLSAALYERFSSRGEADFADRVLSALRYEFGGHEEKAAPKKGGA